jgi:hypothetical protein
LVERHVSEVAGEREGVRALVLEAAGVEKVREKGTKQPLEEGWVVQSNSGVSGVIPAWRLQDLLNQEDVVMERKRWDDELTKRKESSPVVLDAHTGDERPRHRERGSEGFTEEDFEDAVDRVTRRESPPGPES